MITVVDYGAGNIKSVEHALSHLGYECLVTEDPERIKKSDKVILPGVGAFGSAMERLKSKGLDEALKEAAYSGKPFLGICLGLQLLFKDSEESAGVEGLDILPGTIRHFPTDIGLKIPQIGWNSLDYPSKGRLFEGVNEGEYVYFVHSYYLESKDPDIVKATCEYGVTVHASVERDNVFACQFHPEKSGSVGLKILENFCKI